MLRKSLLLTTLFEESRLRRVLVASLALLCLATGQALWADTTISLHDAVRQGKVKVDVKSRGGAAGATVRVEVQRQVPETLRIEVAPGTVLVNSVDTEQNIAVGQLKGEFTRENMYRPGKVMVLADGKSRSFLLEVYCLDYAKKAPRKGGKLELAVQDQRVARILNPPADVNPTVGAVQIAIWMDRAGITAEVARKRCRDAKDGDIEIARQLLVHAEKTGIDTIPDDMPASVKVHVSKLFSSNPEIRARAAAALGKLGAEARPAVVFLAENILDRSSDKPLPATVVRVDVDEALATAAETLEQLRMPALAPLIDSLREGTPDPAAKKAGAATRGIVGDIMVDGLIARLKNSRAAVRERAALVLGASGSPRAVEPLIDLLEDNDQQVRKAAAAALMSLTDQSFGSDVEQWRQWLKNRQ